MKKRIIVLIAIIILLIASFLIGTGFQKRTDVILGDFAVSEDGSEITLHVGVASSMGYIRNFKDKGGGVKPHYLTFYSTFGGLNSSFGSKKAFTLELVPDDTEIYFNRADGGYELVLVKHEETGEWIRPININTQRDQEIGKETITNNEWGITLTAENVTPTSATIKCTQAGGQPTGELQTGSRYILETWTQEVGWQEVPCYAEVYWTAEAWLIPKDRVTEWEVKWERLYGQLSEGKYRIGKEITDFRDTGDYDTAIYYAEFAITE